MEKTEPGETTGSTGRSGWQDCGNALAGADVGAVRAHIGQQHVEVVGIHFRCQWADAEGVANMHPLPRVDA